MISVIICSIDDHKYQQVSANYQALLAHTPHEIIGIHDARSLAEGYNRGISRSQGDVLIFSHDDVEILTEDFADKVKLHLQRFDLIGIAGTSLLVSGKFAAAGDPYVYVLVATPESPECWGLAFIGGKSLVVPDIQALDGVFFACTRRVVNELKFDEQTFDHFHLYDLDFSYRAYLAGYKLAVCRDVLIIHASTGQFDSKWNEYRLRFERKYTLPKLPRYVEGARAFFTANSKNEMIKRCAPARLEQLIKQIDQIAIQ